MNLSDRKWKVFQLTGEDGLFHIHTTNTGVDAINLQDGDNKQLPYITRTKTNNGITKFIDKKNLSFGEDAGECITIGLDTQTAYWQPSKFITGQNIHILRSEKLNFYSAQFLNVILRKQMESKFNWGGNGATLGRLNRLKILLPVNNESNPDFQFMEDYIRELIDRKQTQYMSHLNKIIAELKTSEICTWKESLNECKWQPFVLDDIFSIHSGKRLEKRNIIPGNMPFVGASDNSNGVTGFCNNQNNSIDNNVLGINYNGSVCEAFYHPYECIFSDDVKRLHLKNVNDNKYVLLFLSVIIKQQKSKYLWAYKFTKRRMKRQIILLPVKNNGEPDYDFMEQCGKAIMTEKYKQYLDYIDNTEI